MPILATRIMAKDGCAIGVFLSGRLGSIRRLSCRRNGLWPCSYKHVLYDRWERSSGCIKPLHVTEPVPIERNKLTVIVFE